MDVQQAILRCIGELDREIHYLHVFSFLFLEILFIQVRSNTDNLGFTIEDIPLTLPFPSLLVPTPFTKGVEPTPPAISKTVAPMNVKFCRVLETLLKVLEMLKLFT